MPVWGWVLVAVGGAVVLVVAAAAALWGIAMSQWGREH